MSSVEPTIDGAPARLAAELELLKREQFRTRAALEALEERLLARLEGTADERRAELEAEAARLRLEGAALAKRDVLWRERAIAFFKALENGLGAPGLDAKYRRAIEKTLADFRRLVAPIGLDLIAPEAGSPFDERAHRAIGAAAAPGLPDGVVARCAAWGYRVGDEIVAPAEVLLADVGAAPLEERGGETPDVAGNDAGNAAQNGAAQDVGNEAAAAERSAARRFASGAAWRDPRWAAIAVLAAAAAWFAARPARVAPAASSAERTPAAAIADAPIAPANADARPIARGRDGWTVHVVRPGESLWSIARDAYGDGSLHGLVAAANPGLPAGLPPGTRLRLPGASIKESQR
ncbi:nucleotide exchange factor GrpE [bacterium]|nr:nucleotide exchange factor GrpE [bacterium]